MNKETNFNNNSFSKKKTNIFKEIELEPHINITLKFDQKNWCLVPNLNSVVALGIGTRGVRDSSSTTWRYIFRDRHASMACEWLSNQFETLPCE